MKPWTVYNLAKKPCDYKHSSARYYERILKDLMEDFRAKITWSVKTRTTAKELIRKLKEVYRG